ncbi:dTMP kinase [Qipengyuania atrilutea]|uniref:Thymidylate kinase n=1 Tax=Qipengyuania atrilutea TaxID=2744473 RepID=A0A850GWB3_9SPHN|nr:dTMP kinase [Actirhodobacter atriluteus]NVD43821.1 dTMP kinase [Actirhodobacter atriluteus]
MTRGKFIAFEGGEGCGKSTQAKMLAAWLDRNGKEVILTREPGGTPRAEAIRSLLLDPPEGSWLPEAEALLFAAARSDHVGQLILPALERGTWVVCDRFVDSSRAYQGYAGKLGDEAINQLHEFGSAGLLPDLTLLLEVDAASAASRATARDRGKADAIGGRDDAYHAGVAAGFKAITQRDPERFRTIDGSGSPDEVHDRIVAAVAPLTKGTH